MHPATEGLWKAHHEYEDILMACFMARAKEHDIPGMCFETERMLENSKVFWSLIGLEKGLNNGN
jgi:hypothetical protein